MIAVDTNLLVYAPHRTGRDITKLKVVVHEAEEGGYWAEVPAFPGCATQGESFEELLKNVHEAVEGYLFVQWLWLERLLPIIRKK